MSESVDLVVDLSGWFTGATAVASTTGLFVPLAPERIYDTRLNSFVGSEFCATSGQLGCMDDSIGIRGLDGRQSALLLNATSIRNQGVGFLELGDLPRGETSNVNWVADGSIVANAALVPTPNDRLLVLRSRTSITSVAVDLFGYFTI